MTVPHASIEQGSSPSREARRARFALAALGFTLFYSVAVIFFYYEWLFTTGSPVDPLAYGATLNVTLLLAALAEQQILPRLKDGRALLAVGGAAYLLACCLLVVSGNGARVAVVCAAGACAGVGAALLASLWLDRLGCLSNREPAYVLGIASLVSIPISVLVGLVPLIPMAIVCVVMLAGSCALLVRLGAAGSLDMEGAQRGATQSIRAEDRARGQAEEQVGVPAIGTAAIDIPAPDRQGAGASPWPRLVVPLAYMAILSFVYGTLDDVAMTTSASSPDDSGIISQVCSLVTVAVFLTYVHFDGRRYTVLLNVAVGIVATGLIFLPFLGYSYNLLLMVLTHIGWELSLLVSYALAVEVARGERRRLLGVGALVFAAPRPFVIAGSAVVNLIAGAGPRDGSGAGSATGNLEFAHMVVIACVLLYVTMLAIWLLTNREKRRAERDLARRDEVIRRFVTARDDLYALACELQRHRAHRRPGARADPPAHRGDARPGRRHGGRRHIHLDRHRQRRGGLRRSGRRVVGRAVLRRQAPAQ